MGVGLVGVVEGVDERLLDGPALIAHGEVFGGRRAQRGLVGERPHFKVGAGIQVSEDGIGLLAHAVDAAFFLQRRRRPHRKPEIDEHALMHAGRVVE